MTDLVIPGRGELTPQQARALGLRFKSELEQRGRIGQLLIERTNFARCYVHAGEWIADCPRRDCGNAELMTDKRPQDRGVAWTQYATKHEFTCSYCGYYTNSVHWPRDYDVILDVLDCRPIPHTRNWYPEGHPTAVTAGIQDGETPEELVHENTAHEVPTPMPIIEKVQDALLRARQHPELALGRGQAWRGLHR